MSIGNVYVTDFGTIQLRPRQLEDEADLRTRVMWKLHADDLIGVPEIVPDNNLVFARMQRRARRNWERG